MKTSLDHLRADYENRLAAEKNLYLPKFSTDEGVRYYITLLKYANQKIALGELLVNDSNVNAKRRFYLAGRLYEFYLKKPTDMYHYSAISLWAGLLSDEPNLIHRLGRVWVPDFDSYMHNGAGFYAYGTQKIIQQDWEKLAWLTDEMERRVNKFKNWEIARFDKEVFAGILERDKDRIEAGLSGLTEKKYHTKRSRWGDGNTDVISYPAVGYAKLAWLSGLEVEAVSPLIPKTLLPVQPLNEYPEYDFMLKDPDGRPS